MRLYPHPKHAHWSEKAPGSSMIKSPKGKEILRHSVSPVHFMRELEMKKEWERIKQLDPADGAAEFGRKAAAEEKQEPLAAKAAGRESAWGSMARKAREFLHKIAGRQL